MATAVQKITLSSSRDIPFNKLVLSQSNVRRVKAGISVEELAESIARRGLIQSLHVRPVVDAEGKETGMFEVPAGGRRFRALELLVKQKRLAKIAPVPCVVSEASADVLIDEVSLAENIERAPLHPLDQFRAFQAMREKGMTEEAIAELDLPYAPPEASNEPIEVRIDGTMLGITQRYEHAGGTGAVTPCGHTVWTPFLPL